MTVTSLSLGVTILQQLWWINISLTSNTASSPNVITRSTRSTTADSMLVRFVFPHHHVQHSDQIMICLPILTSPLLPNYHPITRPCLPTRTRDNVGDVISNETGKFYECHRHTSHVHASCFCHAPHTPGKMTQFPSIIEYWMLIQKVRKKAIISGGRFGLWMSWVGLVVFASFNID